MLLHIRQSIVCRSSVTCFDRVQFGRRPQAPKSPEPHLSPYTTSTSTPTTPVQRPVKMSSPSPNPSRSHTPSENQNAIPDSSSHDPDLPLTLASSMILTALPRNTASALAAAGDFPKPKVTVHFKAVGSAPTLRQQVCKISSTQRFEVVVTYLRRVLKVAELDSVFLYVNSSFAPALDEVVGNLHRVSLLIREDEVFVY